MEQVLCKDCKHSFRPITNIIWHGSSAYAYKCRISFKAAHERPDPVVGSKKVPAEYESCTIARIGKSTAGGNCGEQGQHWSPKYKQDLFKFIKRI